MSLQAYRDFIASRAVAQTRHGFYPKAVKMFRRYLGFELKPEYARQAEKNLKEAEALVGDLFGAAA